MFLDLCFAAAMVVYTLQTNDNGKSLQIKNFEKNIMGVVTLSKQVKLAE